MAQLCQCGCGRIANWGKYKRGHNHKLEKGKTYEELYGAERANEIRLKVSLTSKQRYYNDPHIQQILKEGRSNPEVLRRRIETQRLSWTPERKRQFIAKRKIWLQTQAGQDYKKRLSTKMADIKRSEWANSSSIYNTQEFRDKISEGRKGTPSPLKGKHHTIEANRKNSEAHKKLWLNPQWAIRNIKSNQWKPNRPEKVLSYIIRHVCPHMYRYNGDARLGVVLGGKIPDFLNVNGKKQVIEVLGTYWHGQKRTHRTREQEELRLISHYATLGFGCLLIWESELGHRDMVKSKLKEFAGV